MNRTLRDIFHRVRWVSILRYLNGRLVNFVDVLCSVFWLSSNILCSYWLYIFIGPKILIRILRRLVNHPLTLIGSRLVGTLLIYLSYTGIVRGNIFGGVLHIASVLVGRNIRIGGVLVVDGGWLWLVVGGMLWLIVGGLGGWFVWGRFHHIRVGCSILFEIILLSISFFCLLRNFLLQRNFFLLRNFS